MTRTTDHISQKKLTLNVSHSGEYVLCAIGENLSLGVDIEKIRPINLGEFKKIMTKIQWENIINSKNPETTFFKYWTMKESAIKADSRGLNIPLHMVHSSLNKVIIENNTWFYTELNCDGDYCAGIATSTKNIDLEFRHINFYKRSEYDKKELVKKIEYVD